LTELKEHLYGTYRHDTVERRDDDTFSELDRVTGHVGDGSHLK